jgi:glycosyltransferase involved in cell wall biosynthesis
VKRIIVFNAGPLHNQSAGIHVWTKEILNALHDLKLQGLMPAHLDWIIITEKPTEDYPLFQVKTIPVRRYFPGYAALRLFFLLPFMAIHLRANYFIEPAHFGPFNLPRRIKRITVIHDLTPILFPHWHSWFSSLAQRLFFPQILRNADQIIAVSRSTQRDLERVYPYTSGKITVIYPGISKKFTPNPEIKREPFLLFVGTIEPRKNVEGVIKFFEEIKEIPAYRHFKLIIAGRKGWKTSAFDRAYRNSIFKNDISLDGFVNEERKIELYRSCTVFIYLSQYEGFGFPVLEAMACGAPVITSRNSSLMEIGQDSVVYLEGNYVEVFEKSLTLAVDKTKHHFNWINSADSLIKVVCF